MKTNITISNTTFIFEYFIDLHIDQSIEEYVNREEADNKIHIKLSEIDNFEPMNCYIVHEIDERAIIMKDEQNNLEYRLFFDILTGRPYALYKEINREQIEIQILRSERKNLIIDEEFLETIALEKYLLAENSIILHSSSILYNGKAILFTAPSGTGKSTQANLWNKYRKAEIINGDRNILHRNEDGTWNVRGIPFCGTSEINKNVDVPLGAIVRLEQGKTDQIKQRTEMETFKDLYQETTVNIWNSKAIEKVMDMCQKLGKEIDQTMLSCTMNETAVECLEQYLEQKQENRYV